MQGDLWPTATLTAAVTVTHLNGLTSSDLSYSYVWKADGEVIAGATGQSYTLQDAQVGKAITVDVTPTLRGKQAPAWVSPSRGPVVGGLDTVDHAGLTFVRQRNPATNDLFTLSEAKQRCEDHGMQMSYYWQDVNTPMSNRPDLQGLFRSENMAGAPYLWPLGGYWGMERNYTFPGGERPILFDMLGGGYSGSFGNTLRTHLACVIGGRNPTSDQVLVNGVTGKVTLSPLVDFNAAAPQTLTATVTPQQLNGIRAADLRYRYQWSRGATLQGLPKTLNRTTDTYPLTMADVGHIIKVEVRPVYKLMQGNPWTAQTATVADAQTRVNGVTGKVELTGHPWPNQVLTATTTVQERNGIAEQDLSYHYQWSRGGTTPLGAAQTLTSVTSTYQVTAADAGSVIKVATRPVYKTKLGNTWSDTTQSVVTVPDEQTLINSVTGKVELIGTAETGATLTANVTVANSSGIADRDLSYRYQWSRGSTPQGQPQTLASKTHTYPLTMADAGSIIQVETRPVYKTKLGNTWTASTQTSVAVSAQTLVNGVAGKVVLSGTAETGKTLTATVTLTNSNGIAKQDLSYRYVWWRGTTQQGLPQTWTSPTSSYPLTVADAGHTIYVEARPIYQGKQGNPWSDNSQTAVQMSQFKGIQIEGGYSYRIDERFPKVGINRGAFVLQLQDNNPHDYSWHASGGASVDARGKVTLSNSLTWIHGSRTYTITATPKTGGKPTLSYVVAPLIWVTPNVELTTGANLDPVPWADRHNNNCEQIARVTTEAEMNMTSAQWGDPRRFDSKGYASGERLWIDQSLPPPAAGDAWGWNLRGYPQIWSKDTRNTVMCTYP